MKYIFILVALFLHIATAQAACIDAMGVPVAEIPNTMIADIAQANRLPNGAPVIYFNPNVLSWVSPPTRVFFQAHECGHHVLGHTLGRMVMNMEQEADCWAIRTLVSMGMVGPMEMQAIQMDIARFGRGDWSHLPGPQRAINLQECLV